MLSALYKSTTGSMEGRLPFFCTRFHKASTEQGVFFGLAPNARKAARQASMWSISQAGGSSGMAGIGAPGSGRKSRTTTLNAQYSGYRCQTSGSMVGRKPIKAPLS